LRIIQYPLVYVGNTAGFERISIQLGDSAGQVLEMKCLNARTRG
jgi:hypothetical protein